MAADDDATQAEKRAARKRKLKTIGHVFMLLLGFPYLWLFIKMVRTGYLTWIGITAGTILLVPNILIAILGLAGKNALEKRLSRANTRAGLVMLVLFAASLLWSERPGQWKPYSFDAEIAAFEARRAVPDDENAALRYEAALANVDVDDRPDLADGGDVPRTLERGPWQAADHPEVSAWLDSYATVLDELLQIGRMENCRWPADVDGSSSGSVPYKKLIHATRLLALTGNRHLGEGRRDEALQVAFCLLRSADHMRQQPSRVDFIVSFSRERPALPMIRHILVLGQLTPGDLERIGHHLPTPTNTWHEDIARLLEFDEYRFAQFIAPVYEINERGGTRFAAYFPLLSQDRWQPRTSTLMGRVWRLYCHMNMPLDPQGVWSMARQESARMAHLLEPGPMLHIPDEESFLGGSFFDVATRAFANASRWMARDMCFDAFLYDGLGEYYATSLANRRGTWLVLGLRRYHNEHGAWPETLDALAPHVPADALDDPASGDRFIYTRDGDSFTLYSKGLNRIDEGGRNDWNEARDTYEDDIAIWPPHVRKLRPMTKELRMKQLKEIYGQRYAERMLSEPNDNQDAKNRTEPKPQ